MSPMSSVSNQLDPETEALLDRLASAPELQSNCMFQLALMVARIAVEPCAEAYKDETAQALMGLIRLKPKSNVVKLFATSLNADALSQNKLPPPARSNLREEVEQLSKCSE